MPPDSVMFNKLHQQNTGHLKHQCLQKIQIVCTTKRKLVLISATEMTNQCSSVHEVQSLLLAVHIAQITHRHILPNPNNGHIE